MLENGTYALSGITEFSHEDEWSGNTIEGVLIILNDVVYEMCYDPDDGYRSFGRFVKTSIPTSEVRFKFPPQLVELRNIVNKVADEYGNETDYKGIEIFDAKNGKIVLEVGTDYLDHYYPCGNFSYKPENLSINEGR